MMEGKLIPEGEIFDHFADDAAGTPPVMKRLGATCELSNGDVTVQGQSYERAIAATIAALKARLAEQEKG